MNEYNNKKNGFYFVLCIMYFSDVSYVVVFFLFSYFIFCYNVFGVKLNDRRFFSALSYGFLYHTFYYNTKHVINVRSFHDRKD